MDSTTEKTNIVTVTSQKKLNKIKNKEKNSEEHSRNL